MESLVKKDRFGSNTIQKFENLKELYNNLAQIPPLDIDSVLDSIIQCKSSNQSMISQHRNPSFFRACLQFILPAYVPRLVRGIQTILINSKFLHIGHAILDLDSQSNLISIICTNF